MSIIIINPIRSRIFRQHDPTTTGEYRVCVHETRNELSFTDWSWGKTASDELLLWSCSSASINHIELHGNPLNPWSFLITLLLALCNLCLYLKSSLLPQSNKSRQWYWPKLSSFTLSDVAANHLLSIPFDFCKISPSPSVGVWERLHQLSSDFP